MAGDVLNNLWSALDHLAYTLTVLNLDGSPPPKPKRFAFPISTEKRILKRAAIKHLSSDQQRDI